MKGLKESFLLQKDDATTRKFLDNFFFIYLFLRQSQGYRRMFENAWLLCRERGNSNGKCWIVTEYDEISMTLCEYIEYEGLDQWFPKWSRWAPRGAREAWRGSTLVFSMEFVPYEISFLDKVKDIDGWWKMLDYYVEKEGCWIVAEYNKTSITLR